MANIRDLFDQDQLARAIVDGYIRPQQHPTLPLTVLNYTPLAMFSRAWTPVTRTSRGLIIHRETGEIVARPYPKFFGVDDPLSGEVRLDEPVTVTDKVDGALGILYPTKSGQYAVATRGSFTSVPALHATEVWRERYADYWTPPVGMTALFEILYPGWRIVVDYGDFDDLVLLGFVDNESGQTFGPRDTHGWPGPVVETLPYTSFAEALASPPREDAEGMVVHFEASDVRKKLKYDWYMAMHHLTFSLSARRIWTHLAVDACQDLVTEDKHWQHAGIEPTEAREALAAGPGWLAELIEGVPDEFHTWIRSTADEITAGVQRERADATALCALFTEQAAGDRMMFYNLARPHPLVKPIVWLRDGRDITTLLWRRARPDHETPFMARVDDAA
jgi:RNA ligase